MLVNLFSRSAAQPLSRSAAFNLALMLCVCMSAFVFTACDKDELTQKPDSTTTKVLRLETGDGEYTQETIVADAVSIAERIKAWRQGTGLTDAEDREASLEQMQDMINVYAARADAQYQVQHTRAIGFAVPTQANFKGASALALYESIRTELTAQLAEYNGYSKAGIRFVALGGVKSGTGADSVFLVANVGAGNGTTAAPLPTVDIKWADEMGINCEANQSADRVITDYINSALGSGVSATGGVPPNPVKFPFIRGVVSSSWGGVTPGYAANSVRTFDNRGFVAGSTTYTTNFPACNTANTYVNDGQYKVHYDCNSNELCFEPSKVLFYINQHNAIGDLQAKNAAKVAFPKLAKLRRVGHYVIGFKAGDTGNNFIARAHTTTWYFGDFFDAAAGGTIEIGPEPLLP